MGRSVVERRSLIGELSLVCTGPAADSYCHNCVFWLCTAFLW